MQQTLKKSQPLTILKFADEKLCEIIVFSCETQ